MVKQGPCYHCGVTSTPLWRNGPPEKPVLCNACGSRWRTKGTLANYTPIHARTETDDIDDKRFSRVKSISLNKNKEVKKRKLNEDNLFTGVASLDYNQGCRKATDEDISNRSSSGSAISNSESCAQFGGTDASDLTGPAQSVIWDGMVPSKKRTCIVRPKQSAVEKLTKELHSILQEHPSYFSTSSEDDLIFESETPMVSVEIGHGSILMKHPSWIAREEESEASSFSVDNKQCLTCEVYSCSGTANGHNSYSSANFPSQGVQKIRNSAGQGMLQDQFKRNKTQHDKIHALGKKSPLCSVDLNDVINYNEFTRTFTNEEQRQLLQYLTAVDTIKLPDSLESMFSCSQFRENLNYFQQLLAEGVFDLSLSGIRPEDRKTLQQLVVSNLSKSQWVEYYNSLKKHKNRAGKSIAVGSSGTASSSAANPKRYHDSKSKSLSDLKTTMRSPERVMMKVGCKGKEAEEYGSGFSPKNLFTLPSDGDSLMLDSFNFVGESGDQDLLLDVPSNGSFPEAELLHPNLSLGTQASTSSSSKYHNTGHP